MEKNWERFVKVEKVNIGEVTDIMKNMEKDIKITGYKLISKGQRNTNYMVNTLTDKLFLRICADENLSKNEEELLKY